MVWIKTPPGFSDALQYLKLSMCGCVLEGECIFRLQVREDTWGQAVSCDDWYSSQMQFDKYACMNTCDPVIYAFW